MNEPETRYAHAGADRVAYQLLGDGERDLLFTAGLWGHLDVVWENPAIARYLRRLGGFSRLIRFDRRGSGVSDPRPDDGGNVAAHWNEDLLAVLDACRSQAPIIIANIDAGPLALDFVARHPLRCSGLIFANATACLFKAPGYAEGHDAEMLDRIHGEMLHGWGSEEFAARFAPSQARNPDVLRWYAKFQRAMASPRAIADNLALLQQIDSRAVLPTIRVPTLVIAREHLEYFPPSQSRYIASQIPAARYVELPGADGMLYWEGADESLALIEEFVTGRRGGIKPDRQLATVLFTDIVDSTRHAVKLGDAAWRELLDRHDQTVREQISHFGGKLVDSAGDGTLAMFGSPGAAIDCAHAIHTAMKPLRLRVRAGAHIGELELREDGRVGGIAVHIGARVLGMARAGDVCWCRAPCATC